MNLAPLLVTPHNRANSSLLCDRYVLVEYNISIKEIHNYYFKSFLQYALCTSDFFIIFISWVLLEHLQGLYDKVYTSPLNTDQYILIAYLI